MCQAQPEALTDSNSFHPHNLAIRGGLLFYWFLQTSQLNNLPKFTARSGLECKSSHSAAKPAPSSNMYRCLLTDTVYSAVNWNNPFRKQSGNRSGAMKMFLLLLYLGIYHIQYAAIDSPQLCLNKKEKVEPLKCLIGMWLHQAYSR